MMMCIRVAPNLVSCFVLPLVPLLLLMADLGLELVLESLRLLLLREGGQSS